MNWTITPLKLDLKYTWKLSRNSSNFKINYIVKVQDGSIEATGEVAPNIRYNETPQTIQEGFDKFIENILANSKTTYSLAPFLSLLDTLNLPHALRFGIESAYIHLQCKKNNISLNQFLNIPKPLKVSTCYTLPIMEAHLIKDFYTTHNLARFANLKIKVNAETGLEEIKELSKICNKPLMIDANEAWKNPEDLIFFMEQLKPYNIAFVEQPMPAAMLDEYLYLKPYSPYTLMADESCLAEVNLTELQKQFGGVNMKLMKSGGYIKGLYILQEAAKLGMQTMIGCMVETTLGISGALAFCGITNYADLDGFMIIKDEPFGLVKEEDGWVKEI